MDLLDNEEYTNKMLDLIREGKITLGLPVGMEIMDKHIRFKKGQFVVINGHDNVGKTDWILYYFLLLSLRHGLKWCIFSAENKVYSLKRRLIQWYTGRPMDMLSSTEYQGALSYISEHFKFLRNDESLTYKVILDFAKQMDLNGILIDPYNSLIPSEGNRHEFDYEVCRAFRVFALKTGISVYLNIHCVSEATRKVYPKDHEYAFNLMPPNKADTEGGAKWANRADDFITVHRMTQHADRWMITEIHVRKVKDTDTGGRPTLRELPIEFKWDNPYNYITEDKNPIHDIK